MNDTVESAEPNPKRLTKLPLTIAFVIIGVVAIIFVYALIQRLNSSQRVTPEADSGQAQSVQTADNSEIVTRAPAAGVIPEGTPSQYGQPVPSQNRVVNSGQPRGAYQSRPNLAGASQTEQEALAELRTKNALELESYYMERQMERMRFRDSAEQQAKSSPMNVAYDNGQSKPNIGAAGLQGIPGLSGFNGVGPTGLPVNASSTGTGGYDGSQAAIDAQAANLAALAAGQGGGTNDQNGQQNKRDFIDGADSKDDYVDNRLVAPVSPYEIKQGTIIPALMVSGINSDLPGYIIGQVSQNVYDSVTGTHLLIPQGTKIFGQYDSGVTYGQNRVLIVWNRLILPNGKAINVDTMVGSDASGKAGLKDKVNRHLFSLYGQAILLSAITGATEALTQGDNDTDLERAIRREFGDGLQDTTKEVIEREVQRQPTITIRQGKKFVILVDQDMILEPYVSKSANRR